MCEHIWRPDIDLGSRPSHFLRQGLSLGPGACPLEQAGKPASSDSLLSPPPQHWDDKGTPLSLVITPLSWVLGSELCPHLPSHCCISFYEEPNKSVSGVKSHLPVCGWPNSLGREQPTHPPRNTMALSPSPVSFGCGGSQPPAPPHPSTSGGLLGIAPTPASKFPHG